MAFDAGFMAAIINEINNCAEDARVEKALQPEPDEIHLLLHCRDGIGRRLLINAGANSPRLSFTDTAKENPLKAPMFCMLMRKHLNGARLVGASQPGFERAAFIEFETHDDMGFTCRRFLIAEIMGKYSNLIFTDEDKKIIAVLRPVDFSTSRLRQVLPGMKYELPPKQDRENPLEADAESFRARFDASDTDMTADKFITSVYLGIASLTARQIVFNACGDTGATLLAVGEGRLENAFFAFTDTIKRAAFTPSLLTDENGVPREYCFIPLTQFGPKNVKNFDNFAQLTDRYFFERDHENKIKNRASDIMHILTNAETRLTHKLELQRAELADCEKSAGYKSDGDLITANLYQLKKGMETAVLRDYSAEPDVNGDYPEKRVRLDSRLTPAQNAQRLYKKYAKARNAKVELHKQTALAENELEYIYTVFDALTRAETDADMGEIREELYRSGYASKMRGYSKAKPQTPKIAKYKTSGGYTVLCGKNNIQNEYITFKLAVKSDYWFHIKGMPGSHVLLQCGGAEPSEKDFTEAAEIAAFNSKAGGAQKSAVDYTLARNVKKPAGGKPGLVIYHTNWTAYVTPDAEKIRAMRV